MGGADSKEQLQSNKLAAQAGAIIYNRNLTDGVRREKYRMNNFPLYAVVLVCMHSVVWISSYQKSGERRVTFRATVESSHDTNMFTLHQLSHR